MAEPAHPESWQVPQRTPLLAALAVLTVTAVLLAIAGWTYTRTVGAARRQPVHTFPAPGIETYVHDGQGDPPRLRPVHQPDPALAAAKRAVLAEGWRR